ncbi:uncharacterized protein LOC119673799 [Teleopsis dalmanni]|uniref:uncharacterized protein LOC119673799 n=1 Tax=Teleopsis dalmanni TaxID=139649 RepID=UPI0018CF779E|nr:uncharacterized protein LOC119673799 [Teleopsis dalmanni]
MKFSLLLLVLAAVAIYGAPAEESTKAKRGLTLGLGYHAPLVTHSHYVAPAVVHHAPAIVHHAPAIVHSAPLLTHSSIISHHPVSYHYPSYHSYHLK